MQLVKLVPKYDLTLNQDIQKITDADFLDF